MKVIYKLYNKKLKQFSSGKFQPNYKKDENGDWSKIPRFSQTGKSWNMISHIKTHMRYTTYYKNDLENFEIITFKVTKLITNKLEDLETDKFISKTIFE